MGWWPDGGEIEGKRWGVKRTGCNTEGCWGGEMKGLNCWCKRGHTLFFFFSCTHTNAHTALTSCFYPGEVVQGSGVQMKTNNSDWTYCSSSLLLFLFLFLVAAMIKHLLRFASVSFFPPTPSSFLTSLPFPQPAAALDFTQLPLNINSYSLRSSTVRRIALSVRRSSSVFILISIQRATIFYSF